MPPENASASPTLFVMLIELPEIVVFLIFTVETSPLTWIPPPLASSSTLFGSDAASAPLLSVTELLVSFTVPPDTESAPPSAKRPLGALALAWLPWMTEPLIVSGPRKLVIAPPSASLASVDSPDAEPTRLLLTVVFDSLSVPQLSIRRPQRTRTGRGRWDSLGRRAPCRWGRPGYLL